MLGGVSVRDFAAILEGRTIRERQRTREGRPEMHFLLTDCDRVLPVYLGGQTHILQWGTRRGQSPRLPCTAWAQLESLQTGKWTELEPADAVISASRALNNGIWFDVREGIRALVVRDEQGAQVAYPLVEPSSHYYQVMTGSEWMPCLVRQRI
jgi:hypothetical protein